MATVEEISMEGFQVVSGDLFSRVVQRNDLPTITLWVDQIAFSKAAVLALNSCERVRMEVNPQTKGILLIPVNTNDKDGIKWMKSGKVPHGRKIECRGFTEKLYETWSWDPEYVYKSVGRIVVIDQRVMLFFDFSSPESWMYKTKTQLKEEA